MGYSGGNLDYQNFERHALSGGPAHEVSGENKALFGNWTREQSWEILVNNLVALFLLLENLSKIEYKNN